MRIIALSDTHSYHRKVNVPDGDVLVHTGDITFKGELSVIEDFCNWLKTLPHANKIVVLGNHEVGIENGYKRESALKMIEDSGAIYLEDSGVFINGYNFWGSPITPFFCDWEWNRYRGKDIRRHWDKIPDDTNILCTHGPRYMVLDEAPRGFNEIEHVGCEDLGNKIDQLKNLKLSICGHIHNSYSERPKEINGVKYVNAAICTEQYNPINKPVIIEI